MDSRCAALFRPDHDPLTTTDPTLADSDGDGLSDGQEDADHDGTEQRTGLDAGDEVTAPAGGSARHVEPVPVVVERQPHDLRERQRPLVADAGDDEVVQCAQLRPAATSQDSLAEARHVDSLKCVTMPG